jgi:hypothetical protein
VSQLVAGGIAAAVVIFAAGWFTRGRVPIQVARISSTTQQTTDAAATQVYPRQHKHKPVNPEFEHGAPVSVSYLTYLRDAFDDDDSCGQDGTAFSSSCTQDSRSE